MAAKRLSALLKRAVLGAFVCFLAVLPALASDSQGSPPGRPPADPVPETGDGAGEIEIGGPFLPEDPVLDEPPLELLLFDEEDLVEAASRKTSKLSEAPGTVTLISREQMDSMGVLTLGDLLEYLSSSALVPGTVDTALEFRGVQQPFNNKILLLRDGRVLNNVYRGDFFLDLAQPIDDVERVEVVRGPGSALYGANAFAGFINLVTVSGEDVQGVRSMTGLGNHGTWYQNVLTGGKAGGLDWLVTARAAATDGQDPINPERPNNDHSDVNLRGRVSGNTWFVDVDFLEVNAGSPGTFEFPTSQDAYRIRQASVDGKKTWEVGDKFKFAVRASYTDGDNTYEFVSLALPGCEGDDPYCDLDTFSNIFGIVGTDGEPVPTEVRREYEIFLNNPPQLRVKAAEGDPDSYISREAYDAWKAGTLGDRKVVQRSSERRAFTEFQFDWRVGRGNYLLMGGGVQADVLRNSGVGDHTFRDYFVFFEDEQRFLKDQIIGLASVRLDRHSYFGQTASPRVSLIWAPHIGDAARRLMGSRPPLYVKAGYGKAFRSPNFVELFGKTRVGPEAELFGLDQPGVSLLKGNPDLVHESIRTVELQIHWEPGETVKTTLTAYDYKITDEVILNVDHDVVFVLQPVERLPLPFPDFADLMFDEELATVPVSAQFINVREGTQGRGFELDLSWSPRRRVRGLTLWGNYSRLQVDRPVEQELVMETHPESGNLTDVYYTVRRESGLVDGMNLGVLYRDPDDRWLLHYRARVTGRLGESIFSRGGRVAHDLTLGLKYRRFTARLTGRNLTGTDYLRNPTDGTYPGLDPDWMVLLGYRWEF